MTTLEIFLIVISAIGWITALLLFLECRAWKKTCDEIVAIWQAGVREINSKWGEAFERLTDRIIEEMQKPKA